MAKIIHERKDCISCGICASMCPEHWEMGDDGKSNLKDGKKIEEGKFEKEVKEVGCNKEAETNCPANVIHVKE